MTPEEEIVWHVSNYAKYYHDLDKPYVVHWKGVLYNAKGTRTLVKDIAKTEGVILQ